MEPRIQPFGAGSRNSLKTVSAPRADAAVARSMPEGSLSRTLGTMRVSRLASNVAERVTFVPGCHSDCADSKSAA
jgi:hypothetical protein